MIRNTGLFVSTMEKVKEHFLLAEIVEVSKKRFDLLPLKFQQLSQDKILKHYQHLQTRYYQTGDLTVDQNNWRECERRLFVLFIISFEYFLQKQNTTLDQNIWNRLQWQFFGKEPYFLEFQYLSLLKVKNRISWTQQQDKMLVKYIDQQEENSFSWNSISKKIFYETNKVIFKSAKHCRERWLNHLDNKKVHGLWSPLEDYKIFKFVIENGKRWCKMVSILDDKRTEHMIKNRYNSLINKKRSNKKQKEQIIAKKIYLELKYSLSIKNESQIPEEQVQQSIQQEEEYEVINRNQNLGVKKEDINQVEQIQVIPQSKIVPPTETNFDQNHQNQNMLAANHYGYYYMDLNNFYMNYPFLPHLTQPYANLTHSDLIQRQSNFYLYTLES